MKYISPEEGRTKLGNLRYFDQLTPFARKNRKKMTREESIIWEFIRNKNLGVKFLKQKPLDRFILDFYCPRLLLAIEIDGGYHNNRSNYDEGRDLILIQRKIMTLRYRNTDVIDNSYQVKEDIKQKVKERSLELAFSPQSRGDVK